MAVFLAASFVKLSLEVHVPSSPLLVKDSNDISSPFFVILCNHIQRLLGKDIFNGGNFKN